MYQAELYSKNNHVTTEHVMFSLGKYGHLLDLKDSSTVLEVGMGDGNVTEAVLQGDAVPAGVRYVGTDVSVEMVAFARRRDAFRHLELDQLDVTTEVLPERFRGRFDATFGFNVLHTLPRVERALKNIYDSLKPSGVAYLVFFGYTPIDIPLERLSSRPKWAKYGSDKWCSQFYKNHEVIPDYYKKSMADIGFKEVMCFFDETKTKIKLDVFRDLLISVNRVIRDVPEEDRSDYLNDYLEEVLKQDYIQTQREGDEDVVLMTLPLYTVYARK